MYGSYENRSGGRDALKPNQYPLHSVLLETHGAVFGPSGASGVEVPLCYDSTGSLRDADVHNVTTQYRFPWAGTAREEGEHVVQHCGLSYASFSKLLVSGGDARALLESMTTAVLPKKQNPSSGGGGGEDRPCKLTYGVTPMGRMYTEFTICRREEHEWYCVGSRDHAEHDVVWMQERASALGLRDVTIRNRSGDICVLHVAGPASPAILRDIEPRAIDNLAFMHSRTGSKFCVCYLLRMFTYCRGTSSK